MLNISSEINDKHKFIDGQEVDIFCRKNLRIKGIVNYIDESNLTKEIQQFFDSNKRKFISEDNYKEKNYEELFSISLENGDKYFIARYLKEYFGELKGHIDENFYIYEENKYGTKIGYVNLVKNINGNKESDIYIEMTRTVDEYQRQGYGERRLYLLNFLSNKYYGVNLKSSTTITSECLTLRKFLLRSGIAKESFNHEGKEVFEIVTDNNSLIEKFSFETKKRVDEVFSYNFGVKKLIDIYKSDETLELTYISSFYNEKLKDLLNEIVNYSLDNFNIENFEKLAENEKAKLGRLIFHIGIKNVSDTFGKDILLWSFIKGSISEGLKNVIINNGLFLSVGIENSDLEQAQELVLRNNLNTNEIIKNLLKGNESIK